MKESTKRMEVRVAAVGLDLSDRKGTAFSIDKQGRKISSREITLQRASVEEWGRSMPPTVIALEAGGNSAWITRVLSAAGHDVIVANPVKVQLITRNTSKNDAIDAEYLARLARFDRKLLHEVKHRSEATQVDLQLIRSRDVLVRSRSRLVTHVRGSVKNFGYRIPSCGADAFHRVAREHMPTLLAAELEAVLAIVESLTSRIRGYDKEIERRVEHAYPQAKRLMQVPGVGALTALTYILVLEDAKRFKNSRAVGAYLGLTPKRDQSGESDPEKSISKGGDELLRRLLVQSSNYILGHFGKDCDLRRHGEKIARGGKRAKRRAVVAVARKLSVLLHRLWITGDQYQPLRNSLTIAA